MAGSSMLPWFRPVSGRLLERMPRRAASMLVGVAAGGLVLWALCSLSLARFNVHGPAAGAPEAAFRQALDRRIPGILAHYRIPGVAIGTVINGKPGPIYTYGLADVGENRPVRADTVFGAASLTKSVTAIGVLRLVDQGKVELDAPAPRYVSPWPLAPSALPADGLTVRHLLTHTGGLSGSLDEFREPHAPTATASELLGRAVACPRCQHRPVSIDRPPGLTYGYSAADYTVLQMLVEQQSGRPFTAFMQREVLEPLGMKDSTFEWRHSLEDRIATPYAVDGRPLEVKVPQDAAADGLFTTAGDMVRFVAAMLDDEDAPAGAGVISRALALEMVKRPPQYAGGDIIPLGPQAPCMGCFIEREDDGRVLITNAGFDPGWSSQFYLVPGSGDGLVILTNGTKGAPALAQIGAMWADWRGLPVPKLTVAFRKVGLFAAELVALIAGLAAVMAFNWVADMRVGKRRPGGFSLAGAVQGAVEMGLAGAVGYSAFLLRGVLQMTPTFALIAYLSVGLLAVAAVARAACPLVGGGRPPAAPARSRRPFFVGAAWIVRVVGKSRSSSLAGARVVVRWSRRRARVFSF